MTDKFEVAVELYVDAAAVGARSLDLVVALLVADLGIGHATAAEVLDRCAGGRVARGARDLREKIDRPFGVESIETVRGAGYRLREDGGR